MQPVRLNTDPTSLSNGDVSTTAAMSCRLVWQNVTVPWTWNDWRGSGRGLFNVTTVTFNKWLWRLLYLCTYRRHHFRHPSHWRPCGLLRSPVISSEIPQRDHLPLGTWWSICLISPESSIRFICCSQFLLSCCRYSVVGVIFSISVMSSLLLWSRSLATSCLFVKNFI